jgi:hypothetical protein
MGVDGISAGGEVYNDTRLERDAYSLRGAGTDVDGAVIGARRAVYGEDTGARRQRRFRYAQE